MLEYVGVVIDVLADINPHLRQSLLKKIKVCSTREGIIQRYSNYLQNGFALLLLLFPMSLGNKHSKNVSTISSAINVRCRWLVRRIPKGNCCTCISIPETWLCASPRSNYLASIPIRCHYHSLHVTRHGNCCLQMLLAKHKSVDNVHLKWRA